MNAHVDEKPLVIVELKAENIKRLQAVRIRPDGSNVVVIGGNNGEGKTSTLDAIEMAIGGKGAIPPEPIRKGKHKAYTVLDLGDIRVERKFDYGGSKLIVKSKEGEPQRSPQQLLDSLCNKVMFDPLDFASMDTTKQDKLLKQIAGLDFTELDARRKAQYDHRTELNRQLKALEAQLSELVPHAGVPEKEVMVTELVGKLEEARETIELNNKRREVLEQTRVDLELHQNAITEAELLVRELEEKLETARERLSERQLQLAGYEAKAAAAARELPAIEDPDLAPIKQQITEAEDTNRKVRENLDRAKVEEKLDAVREEVADANETIEAIDAEKQEQLEKAKFPVPGLGFSDLGPTLDGVPLEQASKAQKILLGVAMNFAMSPRLRIALIRDGSLLDEKMLKAIAELAEEHGGQVWIERVSQGDECAVIIEDGMVKERAT